MKKISVSLVTERQRFSKLLRSCARNWLTDQGKQVHGSLLKMGYGFDMILSNDLIDLYGKCGTMEMACEVFDRMPERNVVSWTVLMCGHLRQGTPRASLLLFRRMGCSEVKPNEFTFSTNFKACGFLGIPENGMQIHGMCVRTGFEWIPVVGNSTMDMYLRCGRLKEAEKVFNEMPVRSVISWNVMIAGYALVGMGDKSLVLFLEMQKEGEMPDDFTFTSTLKACSGLGAIREGFQIHAYLITRGFPIFSQTIIAGALVDLYVKSGCLFDARLVFDHLEQKSVISWSALILGYAQEGNLMEAMDLFRQLRENNSIRVDEFVLSSMMGVFADFALVEQGKQMHCYTVKTPFGLETSVANSIVDMYLKCGLTEEAEKHFNEITKRNVVSWTVMITGYGKHGLGREAIHLFKKMQVENVEPDGVTYLALLSACSHSGLVEESEEYFSRLCEDRRIKQQVEHYACMVDLLGRAGRLKEAKKLVLNMPLKPNIGIWQTLLSACRVHGNLEMGREVGESLLRLDGNNPTNYVMMSNIYADAGCWKEFERVRESAKMQGLRKVGGCSWVEIDKEIHFFYNGDERHALTEEIHEVLKEMNRRVKEEVGYAYEVRFALRDIEEESKAESLRFHSEKLAIGLALVRGGMEKGGTMIRVFKNLRVCGDCHEFIKGLSKVLKKVFVVRDANRFHKFEDGFCSCKDYW
ncbi:Pentatricopeptide repeat-containing protein [Actinidia chinensis var. chinensis]|uniref:Pentatricopeptide repeat-containing protein n=1 Tax=Actinidia chinensis var. chinensis TaxID=1590841 RepID=A0A2R6QZK2_ACTCC|nr:Pentatricopeptide repeat-containing protein [Actinidia chinensis var. chinensis]